MKVSVDDGRLYIPKEKREKYGSTFEMVDRGDKLILVPIPEDPLKALREEISGTDKSAKELKEEARKAALKMAGK